MYSGQMGGAAGGGGGFVGSNAGGGGGAFVGGPGYIGGGGASCCVRNGGPACAAAECEKVVRAADCTGPATLQFVGGGVGSYITTTEYKFVGRGCGEFDVVRPKPNYCICILSSSVLLLLLGVLLWFLFKDSTNTTTPVPGCFGCLLACEVAQNNGCSGPLKSGMLPSSGMCSMTPLVQACMQCSGLCPSLAPAPSPAPLASSTCIIWGDPHINTFDHKRVDFYTPGQYWIVKSSTVSIQGLYKPTHATSGLSVMKEIAFGGEFMQGRKLIIGTTDATFDGKPILGGFPSNFQNALFSAKYDATGETMQKGRNGKALHAVHLSLPRGVNVQINRWMEPSEGNYINAAISMAPQPVQDGHCGNFNGNAADDDRLQIRARVGRTGVAASDLIFPGGKIAIVQGSRPDINDCPDDKLKSAHHSCKHKENAFIPSMACLIDVCFGGTGFATQM